MQSKNDDGHKPMTVWLLTTKNVHEPPFHFANVAHTHVVAAETEKHARAITATYAGEHGAAWVDEAQTDCVPLAPKEAGLVARDMVAHSVPMVDGD